MYRRHLHILLVSFIALFAVGCSGVTPQLRVIGVSKTGLRARAANPENKAMLFVEVVNPTRRELYLSHLDYQITADGGFDTKGRVSLVRALGAGASAVIEIPLPMDLDDVGTAMPYILRGRLVALEDRVERSWRINVTGDLGKTPVAHRPEPIKIAASHRL